MYSDNDLNNKLTICLMVQVDVNPKVIILWECWSVKHEYIQLI